MLINVTELGILTDDNLVPWNTPSLISVKLLFKSNNTFCNPLWLKANDPIIETLLGILILVKLSHKENAYDPIFSKLLFSSIVMLFKLEL